MISDEDRARPLGLMTPVATSATLGDKNDPSRILTFAHTVFGEDFDEDAVVTESRYNVDEWAALPGMELDEVQLALEPITGFDHFRTLEALRWIESDEDFDEELVWDDRELGLRALSTLFDLDEYEASKFTEFLEDEVLWGIVYGRFGSDTGKILSLIKSHPLILKNSENNISCDQLGRADVRTIWVCRQ